MARRKPGSCLSRLVNMRRVRVARVQGVRLTVAADDHQVRGLLPPRQCALRPVDLDPQVVLASVRNLAGGDSSQGAILEADDGVAIVVELAHRLENLQTA